MAGKTTQLALVSDDKKDAPADRLVYLKALERRVLWLSHWLIHNANHVRPSRDGLKVGGHQASSASVATLMTALYFDILRPEDRVAVKPHASPIFHAIQYLMGRQDRAALENFRALGGAQSYPSRTKDKDEVDFSTGSVGLGVAMTLFGSITQDYVRQHFPEKEKASKPGRMIAVMGDAELDEGNIYEALLEGWKYDIRNTWWVIDYNRQSLDGVVNDQLFQKIKGFFAAVGWKVVMIKYGKLQEEAFKKPGGEALRNWLDDCPNDLYSALVFKGQNGDPSVWRSHILADLAGHNGIPQLLADYDDEGLHLLMTNLGGNDMAAVLEGFAQAEDDTPHCFIAYTIKGAQTPQAGHKDNHAGLMSVEQMESFRSQMGIADGAEWDALDDRDLPVAKLRDFIAKAPFNQPGSRIKQSAAVAVPDDFPTVKAERISSQAAFGHILNALGKGQSDLAGRIVSTSPDVTVSTNLGAWVNQRGIFSRRARDDIFRTEKVVSAQKWARSLTGQHIELGIAENNLFIMLAALGLAGPLFGEKLLPVGTLYDPFIARGLDALNYACYQDARFMLVSTPSGITLAPEGGAHQSISTPLIGMGQPGLTYFEPAYADELAAIMRWGFGHMQAPDGGSLYLRLSTRGLDQPQRPLAGDFADQVVAGAYWLVEPSADSEVALVYCGAVAPEVMEAHAALAEDMPGLGVLAVTSPDRLYGDWHKQTEARRKGQPVQPTHLDRLLALAPAAALVTAHDSHPAALSWIGAASGRPVYALGVTKFGQSADLPDLYRVHGLDADAIIDAVATACLGRIGGRLN
ncbi:MAG: transketolase [Oceanibaculum nanhaiense]|uniref:transketolase n=1 Tax=Oceanibaculum nanhaiense TaxID=1909734 RepID=UPI0025A4827E|nr:transketolase [Oceanibaculum nanhaiense]MDM7946806.1 transketolase [Oceanibaculum nanhaiense]